MRAKKISVLISCTACAWAFLIASAQAQTNLGYGNPFADEAEEAAANAQPVYNGLADAAANLFGPSPIVQQRVQQVSPWQDFNQVDPTGQYSNYGDYAAEKVRSVVNAPMEKRNPFSDPMNDIKNDGDPGALFGEDRFGSRK